MISQDHCQAFEQAWQYHFDGETPAPPSDSPQWDAHLSACQDCAERDQRYRKLRLALDIWSHSPALAIQAGPARIRARVSGPSPARSTHSIVLGLACTAALALLWLKSPARNNLDPSRPQTSKVQPIRLVDVQPWLGSQAVPAHLIKVVSLPVTLLGREVLNSTHSSDTPDTPEVPSDSLRELGGRVISRIQPISSSARSAFGFVIPTNAIVEDTPVSTGRGA